MMRELCDQCWAIAIDRFKSDESKPRHQHYREVMREMGDHKDGHPPPPPPGTRTAKADRILEMEIPLEGEEYPDYVLIRQGQHARAYQYPPGDDKGNMLLALRDALLWCAQHAWEGGDIDGGDFQDEMVKRGILVEVPASEAFREEHDTDVMYVMAWSDDAD